MQVEEIIILIYFDSYFRHLFISNFKSVCESYGSPNLSELYLNNHFKDSVKNLEMARQIEYSLHGVTKNADFDKDSLFKFFKYFNELWNLQMEDQFTYSN